VLRTIAAAGAATFLMSVALAPAATAAPSVWVMPSLEGMNLAKAQELYSETVGSEGPWLEYISNAGPYAGSVRALSVWEVCKQSPAAGKKINAKSWTAVAVNRPGQC
jgi:hypothetical protein